MSDTREARYIEAAVEGAWDSAAGERANHPKSERHAALTREIWDRLARPALEAAARAVMAVADEELAEARTPMTDAWEMHQAETGLNPGPVWRDRGAIINQLTERNQALVERVAELELATLNLRDNTQGAHEREQALRASLQRVVDEWAAHFAEFGITNEWDQGANDVYNELAVILTSADAFRGAASPAEDTTPEPTPADECTCAMTEASQRTCPLHGEDDWLTPAAEPQAEGTTPTEQQAQGEDYPDAEGLAVLRDNEAPHDPR